MKGPFNERAFLRKGLFTEGPFYVLRRDFDSTERSLLSHQERPARQLSPHRAHDDDFLALFVHAVHRHEAGDAAGVESVVVAGYELVDVGDVADGDDGADFGVVDLRQVDAGTDLLLPDGEHLSADGDGGEAVEGAVGDVEGHGRGQGVGGRRLEVRADEAGLEGRAVALVLLKDAF